MPYILSDEDLKVIDGIIERNIANPSTDWVFNGEYSEEVDDTERTIRNTAREILDFIKTRKERSISA